MGKLVKIADLRRDVWQLIGCQVEQLKPLAGPQGRRPRVQLPDRVTEQGEPPQRDQEQITLLCAMLSSVSE